MAREAEMTDEAAQGRRAPVLWQKETLWSPSVLVGPSVLLLLCSFLPPRSNDPSILCLFFLATTLFLWWSSSGRQHTGRWRCSWAFLQHWGSPSELLTAWEHPVGWECAAITCSCIRDRGNEPFLSTCQANNSAVFSEAPKPFRGVKFENTSVFWTASRANKVCWCVSSHQMLRVALPFCLSCVEHMLLQHSTAIVRHFQVMLLKCLHFVPARLVVASKAGLALC